MTRVIAPSRLHFGLFRVPAGGEADAERMFGGVGLMIDTPGVVVTARPADAWQFEGPLASRAQAFALRFAATLPEAGRRPLQLVVERCPAEHTGLGVGTALGLAVAKAVATELGVGDLSAVELAKRVGRGERSAIGVHGFDRGGLVVEPGKLPGEAISPLHISLTLPDDWRVVLFQPAGADHWHGDRERHAFARAMPATTDALWHVARQNLLPAAARGDLDAFGDAVHEFNRRAGEPFAAAQGGDYAAHGIAELIRRLRTMGVRGMGQSSWGPTVFAVVGSNDAAVSLVREIPGVIARVSGGHSISRTLGERGA